MLQDRTQILDIIVGFGSLIIIPFLGILNLFKKVKAFPCLATFLGVWFFLGLLIVGGGATPINKWGIVTPEDRHAWFATPAVKFVFNLWLAGLAIGIPVAIITWFYEYNDKVSKVFKSIKQITTITAFVDRKSVV